MKPLVAYSGGGRRPRDPRAGLRSASRCGLWPRLGGARRRGGAPHPATEPDANAGGLRLPHATPERSGPPRGSDDRRPGVVPPCLPPHDRQRRPVHAHAATASPGTPRRDRAQALRPAAPAAMRSRRPSDASSRSRRWWRTTVVLGARKHPRRAPDAEVAPPAMSQPIMTKGKGRREEGRGRPNPASAGRSNSAVPSSGPVPPPKAARRLARRLARLRPGLLVGRDVPDERADSPGNGSGSLGRGARQPMLFCGLKGPRD